MFTVTKTMSTTYDKDPYEVLGVARDADATTIKKAYRKLALQHHPDRKTDPAEKEAATSLFADISGAYEILTDETMRKQWDRDVGSSGGAGRSGNDGSSSGGGGGGGGGSGKKKKAPKFKFNPSDPYEVWKRDFEDQFGRPYPGAVADVVSLDTHIYQKREGVTDMKKIDKRHGDQDVGGTAQIGGQANQKKKGEVLRLENGQAVDNVESANESDNVHDGHDGKDVDKKKKKKGFFARLFGKKDKNKDDIEAAQKITASASTPDSSTAQQKGAPATKEVPAKKIAGKSQPTETALVVSSKNKKDPSDERAIALRNPETAIVEHEGDPIGHDNRPISMEVTVEEAADGSTVTTTTITRPDGTVEKCVQRTGIPGKDPKKLAQLEGEKTHLAIEDAKTNLAIEGQKNKNLAIGSEEKKLLALKNGETNSKSKRTNSKGQMLITSG